MARPPAPSQRAQVHILRPEPGGRWKPGEGGGPLGGGLWLLRRFTADVDDPDQPYVVTLTVEAQQKRMVPVAMKLSTRHGGDVITSTSLRAVKVDACMAAIRKQLGAWGGGAVVARRVTGKRFTDPIYADSGIANLPFTEWHSTGPGMWEELEDGHRRRRPPSDTLPVVAETYRAALDSADPWVAAAPTQYVADTLLYSRGHAARLVSQARKEGLLGEAAPSWSGRRNRSN